MLTRLFLYIISTSVTIRRSIWRWWYQRLAAYYPDRDWRFMNYGYAPLESGMDIILEPQDEEHRYFIQLYHYVLSNIDLTGKSVLEVGSGRGGGADYVARYLKPRNVVGIDLSKNAVSLSNQFYSAQNLGFAVGDAEHLPLEDDSFDVVYNVESSHCYGDMKQFVSEVKRVLRPGGIFAWADLRDPNVMQEVDSVFQNSGLTVLHKEEITDNVLKALELFSDEKQRMINERTPWYIRNAFMEFAAVRGTEMHRNFKEGRIVYWLYLMQKP